MRKETRIKKREEGRRKNKTKRRKRKEGWKEVRKRITNIRE